jgi:putative transposase
MEHDELLKALCGGGRIDEILVEALRWLIRLEAPRPSSKLWTAFEDWLAGNTRHRETYYQLERQWPQWREQLKMVYPFRKLKTELAAAFNTPGRSRGAQRRPAAAVEGTRASSEIGITRDRSSGNLASGDTARYRRRQVLHVPGGIYHVIQRGNIRQPIFTDAADYAVFERLLATALARCRARVHAFCWEANAIHLAVQATDVPIGRLMQRLTSQYARHTHRRHGTAGALFQQRYHWLLIDPHVHLLKLVRHLHLLPIRSGVVSNPRDYALSSHRAYLGLTRIPWLTTDAVQRLLAPRPEQARYAFRKLMFEAPAPEEGSLFERGGDDPRILGDRQFMANIPRHMRVVGSTDSLDRVIDAVSRTLNLARSEVLSHSRQRRVVLARALITWYATERGVATLAEVGRKLRRDPSTLFVGVERYRVLRPELFNLTALPEDPSNNEEIVQVVRAQGGGSRPILRNQHRARPPK